LTRRKCRVGFVWKTDTARLRDMAALAVEAFGPDVSDSNHFTYRTLRFQLTGGEARCLVVYRKATSEEPPARKDRKWLQFWQ